MAIQKNKIFYGAGLACPHFFLCNYCPRGSGPDRLSRSLLRFKSGEAPDREAWIGCALEALENFDQSIAQPAHVLIIRALHHNERLPVGGTALDLLGQMIAEKAGAVYFPSLLGKRRPTQKFTSLHKKSLRRGELEQVYYIHETPPVPEPTHVLLLDDIVTTGATVSAILRVVTKAMPRIRPLVFSLAKASPDPSLNQGLSLKGNYGDWEGGWVLKEDEVAYGEWSLVQLRDLITGDAF